MTLTELQRRLLDGDPSVWQRWNPQPIDEAVVWDAWRDALARRGSPGSPRTVQVYAHFPYCESSCNFCMYFHRVPREVDRYREYTDYLVGLVRTVERELGAIDASSVYFGGGTPSAMPHEELDRFLQTFGAVVTTRGEFTFEGHPRSLDPDKIALLARRGVNKISMGLQTFDAAVLRRVTRRNRGDEDLRDIFRAAHDHGLVVDVDLMFGLPEQTRASFRADVGRLIDLGPDEITLNHYHPVHRLPIEPSAELAPDAVFDAEFAALVREHGYLWEPVWKNTSRIVRPPTRGPRPPLGTRAVAFARRKASRAIERLQSAAPVGVSTQLDALLTRLGRLAFDPSEASGYSQFDSRPSHTLGLGPASYSHLFGHSAYREVTSLDALAGGRPVYFGTRLSPLDECRRLVLDGLTRDAWLDDRTLRQQTGEAASLLLRGAGLDDEATWERRGRRFRLARQLTDAQRVDVKLRLLPPLPPEAHIKKKLVVAPVRAERELVAGHTEQLKPAQLARRWCQALGVAAQGAKFHGALVRAIGDDQVDFAVDGKHGRALTVLVRSPGQGADAQCSDFAISFATRDTAWTPRERALMTTLARETRKLG